MPPFLRRFAALLLLPALAARAEEVDLSDTCLKLAAVQEPDVDVAKMKEALAALEAKAKKRLEGVKEPREVVAGLNEVLLLDRKVSYISNKYWRDSTLAASVLRGQGNCLSTSTLFAVIGQRLGLPIHAVTVPGHAFARFDDGKTRINIETTNRGVEMTDAYYRSMGSWSDEDAAAIGHGLTLSSAQFASLLHSYAGRHLVSLEKHTEALAQIDAALKLWPANEEYALERLGMLYDGLGKRAEALKGYQRLAKEAKSPEIRARSLVGIANDLQATDRNEEALDVLRRAFHDAPKSALPAVLTEMAASYRTLRRFNEALTTQDLALAATFQPEADDYTLLAIYYKNANLLDDAIRCLKHSVERNPEDWNTRLILAGYLIRGKRDDEGWELFKTVQKPPVDEQFYETNMAWFFGSVGKKKEFLEHLGNALDLATEPSILNYIKTEVDFDKFRDDAEFKALVEKHRKRLMEKR
ncbi:MAG: hypothetical protein IT452_09755 [Planctomycetia bacterium]|nr:hypothetical protein [Planctomycetia bacterium]